MGTPVIVDAVRTPLGKRKGWLAGVHPAVLLGFAQRQVLERAGIDSELVEQVVRPKLDLPGHLLAQRLHLGPLRVQHRRIRGGGQGQEERDQAPGADHWIHRHCPWVQIPAWS